MHRVMPYNKSFLVHSSLFQESFLKHVLDRKRNEEGPESDCISNFIERSDFIKLSQSTSFLH